MGKREVSFDDVHRVAIQRWGEFLAASTEAYRKHVWNEALNLAALSLAEKCDCPAKTLHDNEHSIGCVAGWPADIVRGLRL